MATCVEIFLCGHCTCKDSEGRHASFGKLPAFFIFTSAACPLEHCQITDPEWIEESAALATYYAKQDQRDIYAGERRIVQLLHDLRRALCDHRTYNHIDDERIMLDAPRINTDIVDFLTSDLNASESAVKIYLPQVAEAFRLLDFMQDFLKRKHYRVFYDACADYLDILYQQTLNRVLKVQLVVQQLQAIHVCTHECASKHAFLHAGYFDDYEPSFGKDIIGTLRGIPDFAAEFLAQPVSIGAIKEGEAIFQIIVEEGEKEAARKAGQSEKSTIAGQPVSARRDSTELLLERLDAEWQTERRISNAFKTISRRALRRYQPYKMCARSAKKARFDKGVESPVHTHRRCSATVSIHA